MTVAESVRPAPDALAGRVILVTGASGGLGAAMCRQIAAAGGTPILCGRRVRPLEKLYDEIIAAGAPAPAIYPIDLEGAGPGDYADLAQNIERELGRLDGLVHAAAYFTGLMTHAQTPPEDWLKSIQVNLNAPVALTQACMPLLANSDAAAVLLILDDNERVGRAHWGAYGVAKFALRGLFSQWTAEWENTPLRAHALVPKPMRTRLRGRAYFAENPGLIDLPDQAAKAGVELLSPAGSAWRGRIRDLNGET